MCKIWQDKALLIAISLLVIMVFMNYMITSIPSNFVGYTHGYMTYRGFATDFVDVFSELILAITIKLVSKYKSTSSKLFFLGFVLYFYSKLLLQVLLESGESENKCLFVLVVCLLLSFIFKITEKNA